MTGVERPLLVHLVEPLGLRAAQADALLGDDPEARPLKHGVDLAGDVAARGIRLDDRQRPLDGHGAVPPEFELRAAL
jgi:hypothetical protein